jgi:fido (protein-threonine AMPylation protein)
VPDPLFELDDEANTPLTPEECEALIPSYITLRHELNEAEQINIGEALRWTESRKCDVLDREFLRELHRHMFGEVWRWAGQYRTTARNIGVDAYRITMDVQQAIDDARYWVQNATLLEWRTLLPASGCGSSAQPNPIPRAAAGGRKSGYHR